MKSRNGTGRNHIYTLRRIRGLRQKQLAFLLGYRGCAMVSRFETGRSLPTLRVALLMELILGARIADIYRDEHERLCRLALRRCAHLPPALTRQVRGRILGKD
jgi:DNA-binding XRE family transcriptional regulator